MTDSSTNTEKSVCGVVMPISAIDGCDATHWSDVYEILKDVIVSAGFSANLVSNADDVGVIHKRIIQNLYHNPIIVCDVSGKNPNVMFELGVRLGNLCITPQRMYLHMRAGCGSIPAYAAI